MEQDALLAQPLQQNFQPAAFEEAVSYGRQYLRMGLLHSFKPGHGYGPLAML